MFPEESVEVLEGWMRDHFPDCEIQSGRPAVGRRMIFRATCEDGRSFELAVTEQAMEGHPAETILSDLNDQDVATRLRDDPTMQLCYYKDRSVPWFESWILKCDGQEYRIVRDSGHNVVIYDESDEPLADRPEGMRVLRSSIFDRQRSKWCQEIRSQRGVDQ